jgi:hypothetical protein
MRKEKTDEPLVDFAVNLSYVATENRERILRLKIQL